MTDYYDLLSIPYLAENPITSPTTHICWNNIYSSDFLFADNNVPLKNL
jgi:hypothetical protein